MLASVKFGEGKQVEELVNPARCLCGKSARWQVTVDQPGGGYASEYYCDECLPADAQAALGQ